MTPSAVPYVSSLLTQGTAHSSAAFSFHLFYTQQYHPLCYFRLAVLCCCSCKATLCPLSSCCLSVSGENQYKYKRGKCHTCSQPNRQQLGHLCSAITTQRQTIIMLLCHLSLCSSHICVRDDCISS